MSNYAVLDSSNLVINRIVAESLEEAAAFTNATCVECDGTSSIGDTWDGTSFVKPVVEEEEEETPAE
jgi:hypothetical protein